MKFIQGGLRQHWLAATIAYLAVSMLAAQTPHAASPTGQSLLPASKRAIAPDFTLPDVSGKEMRLSAYKGRVVLLDFWATTCGGCKVELPWYVDFDTTYRNRGLTVIGLDMYGETVETIKPFMSKWHMVYPVAIGTDAIGDRFGLKEMPLTVLIDKEGRVAVSHAGIVDRKAFEDDIQRLLHE